MNIVISPAAAVYAGTDASICSSAGSYHLTTSTTSNSASVLWTTNGTGSFDNAASLNATYTPSASDIATGQVQLTLSANGIGSCAGVSDFMVLNIWKAAAANAGVDASICSGNKYVLQGINLKNHHLS